jgi:hypothetical protein
MPIRRFDVFAEYHRQEKNREGVPEDEAAGYGIWLAKVVAARRFGGSRSPGDLPDRKTGQSSEAEPPEKPHTKFRTLGDEPQTDETFEREIVRRMGERFYREVFSPAIARALEEGRPYTEVRDSIRRGWNVEAKESEGR